MDHLPVFAHNYEQRMAQWVMGSYDSPAFVRRARHVRETYDRLLAHCGEQQEEWLKMPRLHLHTLRGLAGGWDEICPDVISNHQLEVLRQLETRLQPSFRLAINVTGSKRKLRGALGRLCDSLRTFNSRWSKFLTNLDLQAANEAREGYNRYYLLEKECALRSWRLARQGFQKLPPLTLNELTSLFPLLAILEAT
jgi:hypothetical protein